MPRLQPDFVDAPSGRLFCLNVVPDGAVRGYVCHLPAFAEEMNKARHMVARAAWAMAEAGWHVVILDPFGTGDSEGEFGEATWSIWVRDAAWCRHSLKGIDTQLPWVWWGVRSGALLASAAASAAGGARLLLWQPVGAGKQFLTQFLRLKLASESLSGAENGVDTKQLRAELAAGGVVEIGGYALSPGVAEGLEAALLAPPQGMPIAWLEISAREEPDLLPASRQRVEALKSQGHTVWTQALAGQAFWQTLEIAEVPALIDASLQALTMRMDEVPA